MNVFYKNLVERVEGFFFCDKVENNLIYAKVTQVVRHTTNVQIKHIQTTKNNENRFNKQTQQQNLHIKERKTKEKTIIREKKKVTDVPTTPRFQQQ